MASSNSSLGRIILSALALVFSFALAPAGSAEPALGRDFNLNNVLDAGPASIDRKSVV